MPLHDWSGFAAYEYHPFHSLWIVELQKSLNNGLLPDGFYAVGEQQSLQVGDDDADDAASEERRYRPDVLTLTTGGDGLGVAVLDPPKTTLSARVTGSREYAQARRMLAIRHTSGHRPVAMIEIASPGNKDGGKAVEAFVEKCQRSLRRGLHLVVLDPLPPRLHDPAGLAIEVATTVGLHFEDQADGAVHAISFDASSEMTAYAEVFGFGDRIADLPLFIAAGHHIPLPLDTTYEEAVSGCPPYVRTRLAGQFAS